jgi:hypothetical protein
MAVVYFLQVQPNGPIKIGTTGGNPYARMVALQQASPHVLKWIGMFEGGKDEEGAAHKLLENSKLRNEWFYPTREVLAFVALKSPDFCEKTVVNDLMSEPERCEVNAFLRGKRGDAWDRVCQVARAIGGTDVQSIWRWMAREAPLSKEKMRKAAEFVRSLEIAQ